MPTPYNNPRSAASAYLDGDRVAELWTAIKTALAGKADLSDLDGYTTPDAVATAITSALANYATNASVQTAISTALADYMTASAVSDAIAAAIADAAHISVEIVDELPETGTENVIYFVPAESGDEKEEYMWINETWELIGTTSVDLSGYWSKNELRAMTAEELQAILV